MAVQCSGQRTQGKETGLSIEARGSSCAERGDRPRLQSNVLRARH